VATTVAVLEAKLIADTRDFDKDMDKSDSKMGSLAKTMGKAGLAGAVVGLGAAVKVGVGEFMEAQKVTAQTNAVIKSTGGVANVSADEIGNLSEALMKKSGVDDEAIASGQNMLLTFTKIRNETGKGNKIFDQASKATLDLSVAMGKDMKSSAILVGKALNDPVKGATALSRAGVQLTEDQKDLIKSMVEGSTAALALSHTLDEKLTPAQYKQALQMESAGMSVQEIAKKMNLEFTPAQIKAAEEMTKGGRVVEAQKILLGELETQFGGSAEAAGKTFAGQISIARERLTNFSGTMVEKSIPVLQALVRVVQEHVIPAVRSLAAWVGENVVPVLRKLWEVGKETWQGIARVLKENEEPIGRIMGAFKTLGETALWLVEKVVIPVLKPLFTTVLPIALGFTIKAMDTWLTVLGKVKDALGWLRDKGGAAISTIWKLVEKPLGLMTDAFGLWWAVVSKIIDGIKWLIDNIKKIPIPNFGGGNVSELPAPPGRQGTGDGDLNLMGASPVMAPFAASAAGYGLHVTSGLRPGDITTHGTLSDHARGKALDLSNTYKGDPDGTPEMASFFKSLLGNRSVRQAFYDPLGSIFGGAWSSYREGGHSDHVHVATYDKGGVLKPGWTMAYNGTGQNEYVNRGAMVAVVNLDGREIARAIFDPLKSENIRQGKLGRGLT
jgi:hypothetical protein